MVVPLFKGMHVNGRRAGPACPAHRCDRFERMSICTVRAAGCRWGFRLAVLLMSLWKSGQVYDPLRHSRAQEGSQVAA